jgi:hypothetical protein
MNSERNKSVWPWIVALFIALPVLYLASFGPASRLAERRELSLDAYAAAYRPVIQLAFYGPRPIRKAIWRWAKLWGAYCVLEDV